MTFTVTVIGTTPLPGVELPAGQVPGPVQTATDRDIDNSGALDVSDFLNRRMNGVHVNEVQNNPFQPDVNYRGYTASPLLGTPQGLSVYMDGVRLNQPFGEVVSWDLIPRIAIGVDDADARVESDVRPQHARRRAVRCKRRTAARIPEPRCRRPTEASVRRALEFEHGGQTASKGFNWYLAGNLFAEDGWRDDSPSDVRQIFGKIGWQRDRGDVTRLGGTCQQLADRQRPAGFPAPRSRLREHLHQARHDRQSLDAAERLGPAPARTPRLSLLANAYYRDIRTDTVNGDINEESLDQAVYQPNAAEQAALRAAGYTGFPTSGENASNTPFPSWRCIGNALLEDEPSEKCNGLINQTHTSQHNGGMFGQVTHRRPMGARENVFTVGGGFDRSTVGFAQSTELGYLNPDRSVTGVGAFGDGGVTGGDADGEPYDTRVDLDGDVTTWSVYLTDTLPLGSRAHVTLAGRYNRTSVQNRDQIEPGGGPGSLDGDHVFERFNPAAGVTIDVSPDVNLYAGYNEGSRAATSIELGCADPEEPCKLPNAMAGDPPLNQVVTRTVEGGIRGTYATARVVRGCVPCREPRRHPVCDLGADGVWLLQELRSDTPAGARARCAEPGGTGELRRGIHVPARHLRERGDRQRREQQHERCGRGWRAGTRRRDRDRARRSPAVHSAASVEDLWRCAAHESLQRRHRPRRERWFVRAWQRKQPARTGRHVLSW